MQIQQALFDPFLIVLVVGKSGRKRKIVWAQGGCELTLLLPTNKFVITRHVEVVEVGTKEQFFSSQK